MDGVESFPDVKSYNIDSMDGDERNTDASPTEFDSNELHYDMFGEKYLVIFNHYTFFRTVQFWNSRPCDRKGTEEDVISLKRVFTKMGYKVLVYNDFIYDDIMKTINNISKQDHSHTACLCIAILTHGDRDDVLYAADTPYTLRDITFKLENGHQGLVGKPKLFFIQACRGGNIDAGRRVHIDGYGSSMKIPSTADFFFLRSSVEGYFSYRSARGSFLIQELCNAVENNYDKDIHYITTIVNRNIAYFYTTYTPKNNMTNNKKQMPEVRHSLTKLFKFYSK